MLHWRMPPRSRFPKHPVRLLRSKLNLTREEFAKIIGTSVDTIVSVENNRLAISSKLARRISFITGANYAELMKGVDGRLVGSKGGSYRAAEYRRRKGQYTNPQSQVIDALASDLSGKVETALRKSLKKNVAITYCDIREAIESIVN